MLDRMTGGRYRSVPHRVAVNRSGRDRLSIPLFFDPDFDTVILPVPGGGTALPRRCMMVHKPTVPHDEVRRQAEHRIRRAASLARPGWIWAAAVIMNLPSVAGAGLLAWFAFTADGLALTTVAGVLFVLALYWAFIGTADSWQVLRRFARRFRQGPKQSH